VRQLNFYNFRKVNRERTFWIYRHKQFHRDRPEDLHLLRRRTCFGKNQPECDNASDKSLAPDHITMKSPPSHMNQFFVRNQSGPYGTNIDPPHQKTMKGVYMSGMEHNGLNQHYPQSYDKLPPYNNMYQRDDMQNLHTNDRANNVKATFQQQPNNSVAIYTDIPPNVRNRNPSISRENSKRTISPVAQRSVSDHSRSSSYTDEPSSTNKSSYRIDNSDIETKSGTSFNASNSKLNYYKTETVKSEKISRAERNEQALLVSQVSRQLEAYARRAESGLYRGGRGRGHRRVQGGIGGFVTPPPCFHDTMTYHALTYDDEIGTEDLDDLSVSLNDSAVGDISDRDTRAEISDDSDSSEGGETQSSQNQSRFIHSKIDTEMMASIERKLSNGYGGDDGDGRSGLITAAICRFCLMNQPFDEDLSDKISNLLARCVPLDDEFERYHNALNPAEPSQSSGFGLNRLPFKHNLDKHCGNFLVREFMTFSVNYIENLLMAHHSRKNLSNNVPQPLCKDEAAALQNCARLWCNCIPVQS